ncbi:TPA: MFS transporter [Enterobacter cancerogenus]|uniref:MFS transporter n=1 Tax=Enterobacter cancerogenus TaxID=69218 RepID=UPI001299C7FB|nr:MFS transporter [Enterobacter cancerogenus]MRG34170.1 MFS transporter [Enterobacter cancerogenus]QZY39494.1 MFS transporter [Enterobacter cancerogenus]
MDRLSHTGTEPVSIIAVLAVSLSTVIAMLDSTIANVALPLIAKDFSVSESASILIINAYQFAVIATLLPFSALGRTLGNTRIFMAGVILFALSSLGCSLSTTLNMLTIFRIIQGLGAAAILSVNAALIKAIYPPRLLGRGLGINVMVVSVSAAAGPSVASSILSLTKWNWLFTINIPVACLSLILGCFSLRRVHCAATPFDSGGAGLVFLTCLSFACLTLSVTGNHAPFAAASFIALLILGRQLVINQKTKQAQAMIPMAMFASPVFSLSLSMSLLSYSTQLLSYSTQLLAYVALPFYFHNVLHRDVVQAGLMLTAWPLATMMTSLIAGELSTRFGAERVAIAGLGMLVTGMLLMTWLPPSPSDAQILWRVALCGFGFGLFQSPNNLLIMTSVSPEQNNIASGLLGTSRLAGQITGSALVAVMFNVFGGGAIRASMAAGALFSLLSLGVSWLRLRQAHVRKCTSVPGDDRHPGGRR